METVKDRIEEIERRMKAYKIYLSVFISSYNLSLMF